MPFPGTEKKEREALAIGEGPAIILVRPQLGENIGTAARAMLNCGLIDMRLASPREDWFNQYAEAAASGATSVLNGAKVYPDAASALGDLNIVYAMTARRRDMTKRILHPKAAIDEIRAAISQGLKCGVLFGPERTGLENDDLSLAEAIIEVPLNPAYSSLNLAQAVLVIGYEWFQSGLADHLVEQLPMHNSRPANREELFCFFGHLEKELDDCGFLRNVEKRPTMVRNIRNLFQRANLSEQEIRTLHGMITELVTRRRRDIVLPAEIPPGGVGRKVL